MLSEDARIGGTLLWYYSICTRQVWLMAHSIEPDRNNEDIMIGRLIDKNSYVREKHQIVFGDNKFDFITQKKGTLVVSEVKKSRRAEKASKLQLAHYLYELEKEGISAQGVLKYPKEKKQTQEKLTDMLRVELDQAYNEIKKITSAQYPSAPKNCRYCAKCAYAEYCWG